MLIIYKKCVVLISCKYGRGSGNVGCMVCSFRVFHLTSVGREMKRVCVPVGMMCVFDEISLTLNPESVCYDEKTC